MELSADLSVDVRLPESLSQTSLRSFAAALETAFASPARVICLRGATEQVFCTGLALDSETGATLPEVEEFPALLGRLLDAPRPTLAIVDGTALGGGVGLAAACDWVIATERATFGLPELLWGLLPAIIWPALTERMSPRAVKSWLLTAHAQSAEEAFSRGLADELVSGAASPEIARRVRSLARVEPEALVRLRRWARDSPRRPLNDALAEGARLTSELVAHPVVLARVAAFLRGEAPWEN